MPQGYFGSLGASHPELDELTGVALHHSSSKRWNKTPPSPV
jgi:hypothetical protein